jgi:hypothetical protein
MMKKIELLADYSCYPLWEYEDNDLVDNSHPSEYPLREETIKRLIKWQEIYDGILNDNDPASSGFATEAQRIAFEKEGISLWVQLKKELGNEYEIVYFSELPRRVLTHLDDVQ